MGRPRKKTKEPPVTRRPPRRILPKIPTHILHTGIPWACVSNTNSPPALLWSIPCMQQLQATPQPPQQEDTQEVVFPDNVVDELSFVPGIWDLAVEMSFLPPWSRPQVQDGPATPLPSVTSAYKPSTSTSSMEFESNEDRWILQDQTEEEMMTSDPAADSPQGPQQEASLEDFLEELNNIPVIWDMDFEMCLLPPPY